MEFTVGGATLDGVEKVCGGFFAEPVQRREATVLAGFGQGFDRLDLELIPQDAEFFRA